MNAPLAGGYLLAAISTAIVAILREHYGRGPMQAKTFVVDDIVLVVMRGIGFTALEQTIMDDRTGGDGGDRVVSMRHDFQRMIGTRYAGKIEELTGRTVLASLSQAHVDPDLTVQMFFLDTPLQGFAAPEITEPV